MIFPMMVFLGVVLVTFAFALGVIPRFDRDPASAPSKLDPDAHPLAR